MREQKFLIKIFTGTLVMSVLMFFSLLFVRVKYHCCADIVQVCGDVMNLIVGTISGIVISLTLSIGKYISEKRRVMNSLYVELIKISGLFVEYNNAHCSKEKEQCIKNIAEYDKIHFNLIVGEICFFFNNKKHFGKIHEKIYTMIFYWFTSVKIINNLLQSGFSIESDVMKEKIDKLDEILLEDGKTKFSKLFETDINTWLYKLAFNKSYDKVLKKE